MNLTQLMKTGYVQIEKMDETIQKQCTSYGIVNGKRLFVTGICANGYRIVICDDRLLALPQWLCRGISI